MASEKYKIFLSSGMREFKDAREKIESAVGNWVDLWVYEKDAGARSQNIQETFTEELKNCDLYIGIFGVGYGKHTIKEFQDARALNIPCHIYEKELKGEKRDEELSNFISEISKVEDKDGLSTCWFTDIDNLISSIERDLGRWVKSRDVSKRIPKLDMTQKYFCNRENQHITFRTEDAYEKFNFFIIDGEKRQSHASLVKRFSIDKTTVDNVKNAITIGDKGSIARLKVFIQMQLFSRFNVRPLPRDLSMNNLVENILPDNYGKVFMIFRIDEDLLSNKDIVEVLHWFSREYCDVKGLPSGAPDFYFFLNIRYNETGASKKKKIRKKLEALDTYVKIEELDNVDSEDLTTWLVDNGIGDSDTSQEAIKQHYFKGESYPMEIAEIQISKLIFDFNNNNQELIQLMNKL